MSFGMLVALPSMDAYRDALSAGLREARKRIAEGSLNVSLPSLDQKQSDVSKHLWKRSKFRQAEGPLSAAAIKCAEQEYALQHRLDKVQRRVNNLMNLSAKLDGHDDDDSVGASSSASESDNESVFSATGSVGKVKGRKRQRSYGKALTELEFQSTRAFLLTLQHDNDGDRKQLDSGGGFRSEGFLVVADKNLPLPIPVESEKQKALEAMLEQLGYLSGLALISVDQTRLPSLYQTIWNLRGQPSCESASASRAQSTSISKLEFGVRFKVDEKTSKISELVIDAADPAWVEIGSALLQCQETDCLRSFCEYYTQYCELYLAREGLFSSIVEAWPADSRVAAAAQVKSLPFEVLSRVLEVSGNGGEMLWLIWEPYFKLQRLNDEEDDNDDNLGDDGTSKQQQPIISFKDEVFKNVREGYSLRTRLELWRRKSFGSQCVHDKEFAALVKVRGISTALKEVVEIMLS